LEIVDAAGFADMVAECGAMEREREKERKRERER
jgi:hypothetical protein